jgi:hypothetical protein
VLLSDLAYSCEFLSAEKTCDLLTENVKAKANREVRCENEEKTSCCYLCLTRMQCGICCKYLGNLNSAYVPVEPEKAPTERSIEESKELKEAQIGNSQLQYCLDCNVELSQAKTELRVKKWKGQKPTMLNADMLPIIVYLCPICGKIQFKADI